MSNVNKRTATPVTKPKAMLRELFRLVTYASKLKHQTYFIYLLILKILS